MLREEDGWGSGWLDTSSCTAKSQRTFQGASGNQVCSPRHSWEVSREEKSVVLFLL